jgi:hypothetical protein
LSEIKSDAKVLNLFNLSKSNQDEENVYCDLDNYLFARN